ncbi:MAG TPA: N-acetyltransferase [Prolixibacteraceae bacterium]|jgi:GNAT superfamily N-acetyltransferase|nr:N-acetyltransferase [Prolixibacteraceae bacterium]
MEKIIRLNKDNIDSEHICCAFSDKKCQESYALKKMWLKQQFDQGYTFRRIDARAKVFIEYCPAEYSWNPIAAPNYLAINCFWVSGQYKGQGYGKQLLQHAIDDAKAQHKSGLVTIVGTHKFHFMSDTKWLLKQGFVSCDATSTGFSLLTLKFDNNAPSPYFNAKAKQGTCDEKKGIVVYYSNRCAFTDYHVNNSLKETAKKRKLPLTIIKLETNEQAQAAPCPATIFGLFLNGNFVTTDLSVCMDSRFDKIVKII